MTIVWKPELLAHAADQLDRHRRGAGHREAQRREVERARSGCVEDRLVQRRRPRQHGDALRGDARAAPPTTSNTGCGHDGRALDEARQPAGLVAEGVEERVDDEVAIALA